MNISRISFRSSFLLVHNVHNKNFSKLSNIQNNALDKNQSISDELMIDKMKSQLNDAQKSESESQQRMYLLLSSHVNAVFYFDKALSFDLNFNLCHI